MKKFTQGGFVAKSTPRSMAAGSQMENFDRLPAEIRAAVRDAAMPLCTVYLKQVSASGDSWAKTITNVARKYWNDAMVEAFGEVP